MKGRPIHTCEDRPYCDACTEDALAAAMRELEEARNEAAWWKSGMREIAAVLKVPWTGAKHEGTDVLVAAQAALSRAERLEDLRVPMMKFLQQMERWPGPPLPPRQGIDETMTLRDFHAAHATESDLDAARAVFDRTHSGHEPRPTRWELRYLHADLMLDARAKR